MWCYAAGIIFDLNEVTDIVESRMLSHQPDYISIYSNSWGPSDSGFVVGGPEKYTAAVLEQGASEVGLEVATIPIGAQPSRELPTQASVLSFQLTFSLC